MKRLSIHLLKPITLNARALSTSNPIQSSGFFISLINILSLLVEHKLGFRWAPSALKNCDKITPHPIFFIQINYSNFQTHFILQENTALLNSVSAFIAIIILISHPVISINYNFQQKNTVLKPTENVTQ